MQCLPAMHDTLDFDALTFSGDDQQQDAICAPSVITASVCLSVCLSVS